MSLTATGVSARYGRGPLVLDEVDLTVAAGETLGIAGPSGSGKSTLARVLCLLHRPAAGAVTVDGTPVRRWGVAAPPSLRRRFGAVFQSPRASVDPRYSLRAIIAEPLRLATRRTGSAATVEESVTRLADRVHLAPELLLRRPHQVSDGQLQRACLARALALDPTYLICDEMTAMLDASSTAQLVRLVRDWQADTGAAVLAVSHDQRLLARWPDRVTVMAGG